MASVRKPALGGAPAAGTGAFADGVPATSAAASRPSAVTTSRLTRWKRSVGNESCSACWAWTATRPMSTSTASPRRIQPARGRSDCRTPAAVSRSQPASHGQGSNEEGAAATKTRAEERPQAGDGHAAAPGRRARASSLGAGGTSSSSEPWNTAASATGRSDASQGMSAVSWTPSHTPTTVVAAMAVTGWSHGADVKRALKPAPAQTMASITPSG